MPKKKFNIYDMNHGEIYEYIKKIKKERNNYKAMYQKAQQRYEDMLLKYEKPKEPKKDNPYFIDGFTVNISN